MSERQTEAEALLRAVYPPRARPTLFLHGIGPCVADCHRSDMALIEANLSVIKAEAVAEYLDAVPQRSTLPATGSDPA